MLESVKISRRQSEIRQALAALVGKEKPTEDETRSMETMDLEYRQNEVRYRASLIAEDQERREAKDDLETRAGNEWADLVRGFELRQVALALDEGRSLTGKTAEVVSELRERGGYQGYPVPLAALETRAGETVAAGTPDPIRTMPIVDRLFPQSVAGKMGVQVITIDHGEVEWPVTSSAVTAAWAATETGNVGGPTVYTTADKAMAPNNTLGITMTVTRKALKQSGPALEAAIRRDMAGTIAAELDKAVFLGAGSSGEPLGLIPGYSTYGIALTSVGADASWAPFRAAITRFMTANAASGPGSVRLLIRPELWDAMDAELIDGTAVSEWDRLLKNVPAENIAMSSNALAAPGGSPDVGNVSAVLTTVANGLPPAFCGLWGAVDVIRDPYSLAPSGSLKITGLLTCDVTAARGSQVEILQNLETK